MLVNCEPWSIARQAIAKQMPRGGMDEGRCCGLPPPDCHEQGLENHILRWTVLHFPANSFAQIEINHYCQIGKAFASFDIGDVSDPDPIWCAYFKWPRQRFVDSD